MFEPLRAYFEALNACPVTIQRFFDDVSALFWLKFVDSQLALCNKYVLQTEGKKIASFEVAIVVAELREIIENRQKSLYIPAEAKGIFVELTKQEQLVATKHMQNFYSELNGYLLKWSRSLDGTEVFSWMTLTSSPDWEKDIRPSLMFIQQHHAREIIDEDTAFDEAHLLKQSIRENLFRWNEEKISSEQRWIEILKNLSSQNRPINQISLMVQYAFAIPGTSSEVERLFSIIKDVWGPDRGQMSLSTLEAILNVKVNCDLDCDGYYESIKHNRKLLAKVHAGDKY